MEKMQELLWLISGIRDRGADGHEWRSYLARQLANLTGHQEVALFDFIFTGINDGKCLSAFHGSLHQDVKDREWIRWVLDCRKSPSNSCFARSLLRATAIDGYACGPRQSFLNDADWEASFEWSNYFERNTIRPMYGIACQLDKYPTSYLVLIFGGPDAKEMDGALAEGCKELFKYLQLSVGRVIASIESATAMDLTPRRREVLHHLLLGQSDKEISESLNLAFSTVRGHVKEILRHYGAMGRNQLMAQWIRYGFPRHDWGKGEEQPGEITVAD